MSNSTLRSLGLAFTFLTIACGCTSPDQSLLVYRVPYADGTQVRVRNDHLSHRKAIDMNGVSDDGPYRIVVAQTGVIRIIEDGNTQNCPGGTCPNNYVWVEHPGVEWTKYGHVATGSVTGDAGLSVGDVVIAGTFLGIESDVGNTGGELLHFEVAVPNDPANPLKPGPEGFIDGKRRIPRICRIPGVTFVKGNTYTAQRCDSLLDCIQSQESPSTEGNCGPGLGGDVCVQEIRNVAITSTYNRGEHFNSSTLKIDLEWCPNADCDPDETDGRAVQVTFILDIPDSDPIGFIANCQNRRILETVHNVQQVIIDEVPNLSPANTACNGNQFFEAFARWEICEVSPLLP